MRAKKAAEDAAKPAKPAHVRAKGITATVTAAAGVLGHARKAERLAKERLDKLARQMSEVEQECERTEVEREEAEEALHAAQAQ